MFLAVEVTSLGGPEVLQVVEHEDRRPGPGEVLAAVEAVGVNFRDIYERTGGRILRAPPFVAGIEGAGRVLAVGSRVASISVGQRVAWVSAQGSYAERLILSADRVIPVPATVDTDIAAAVALQGITAHYLATDCYRIKPGDTVLVHAAAGGVGRLLTQIGKLKGATVIGTVSTLQKEEIARAAGADHVIRYDLRDLPMTVKQLTKGRLVDCVYDGVGRATFAGSLASLRTRGTLVAFGVASGPPPPVEIEELASGSFYLTRPRLEHYIHGPGELTRRASDVFGWLSSGQLTPWVSRKFPLVEAAAAQAALEARSTTGKILLLP